METKVIQNLVFSFLNTILIYQNIFTEIASDNEDSARQPQQSAQDNYDDEEDTAPKSISKLPSFKKKSRNIDDEESARLEEVRREIREIKNNGPRRDNDEDEDEGPVDPRQGKKK
jgi:transcription factor SPN1